MGSSAHILCAMALPMKKAPMKAASMKKATKATKAMKAMKAMGQSMKAKRVSVIAKGKRAKSAVFAGRKEKTVGGLRKDALKKNSKGKIVSKKASARAQKAYAAGRGFRKWAEATKKARKALGL